MTTPTAPPAARFRERLVPGPGTIAALLLLGPAVYVVVLPLRAAPIVPLAIAIAVTAAAEAVLVLSTPVLTVADGELRAGPARIAVALTGETESFRREEARAARGTGLDARAWTLIRGWVDPVVRIALVDPDDPAPYWLLSTRRPDELRAALAAEHAASR